jgi:hypothetical protein
VIPDDFAQYVPTMDVPQPKALGRSPARYLWAMLLARLYEAFPLRCPVCGSQMRIVAFITESVDVQAILTHLGEPATPPRMAVRVVRGLPGRLVVE